MVHLPAPRVFGTMNAMVPLRTSVFTVTGGATKFSIHTIRVVILPARGAPGGAPHPDCRSDEAGSEKRAGECRKCPH